MVKLKPWQRIRPELAVYLCLVAGWGLLTWSICGASGRMWAGSLGLLAMLHAGAFFYALTKRG